MPRKIMIGFPEFMSIEKFNKLKLRDLTIRCEFEIFKRDFKVYKRLLTNELLSDLELRVGKETYPAHKLILAMSSPLFREIFSMQDSITSLDVTDVEPNIFYELLRYMYRGSVNDMESFAFDLFLADDKYKIWELLNKCEKTIVVNLKVTNVIHALLFCHDRHLISSKACLFNECQNFIRNNFKEVINEEACKLLVKEEPTFLSLILRDIRKCQDISKSKKVSILSPLISETSLSFLGECEFFLNNKNLSDVEIHVGGIKYAAYKLLLSLRSSVFFRMFIHQMKETLTGVVDIEDIEPEVFYEVLRFIYTNKVERIDMAKEILIVANKYEIEDLKLFCETILINKLMKENLLDYLIFSDDHEPKQLKDKCFEFLIDKLYLIEDWNECFADWSQYVAYFHPHLLLEILNKLASDYELFF
ncbi:speckle-type POZ protein-like A [Belonocnema kinseyi]|uniref:speckle-type POZ protein-like A n=1 Tax=Belonocnema kinseyi TaxID=2817044 RepID=UPI00143D2308|nr:speckle-type POZ protein-like A [Belonocnema kinseyi]